MRTKEKKNIKETAHYYAGQKKGYWWKYLLAALIIAIYLIPLYVLFMQSFKSMSDGSTAMGFPEVWRIDNYTSVIKDGTILRAFKNSAIVAVFTIVIEVVLACMAAYPLSRNASKFNGFIRNVFMGVMMIPPLTILVGVYTFLVDLKAINSY